MGMILVDASIAVKWFLPEADSEQASKLLSHDGKLVAPEIIAIEVTGAITKAFRLDRISLAYAQEQIAEWMEALKDGVVGTIPIAYDLKQAGLLSLEYKHPIGDCFYLALARRLGIPFATKDEKLALRAEECGVEIFDI